MPALADRQGLSLLAQPSAPWISWSPTPSEWSWLRSSWLVVQEEGAQVWLQRAVQTYSSPALPTGMSGCWFYGGVLKACIWELNPGLWPLLCLVFF